MTVEALLKQYEAGERDFPGIDLTESSLVGLNLAGINFQRASLNVVNLTGANLIGANLSQAKLNVARLSGVNLSQATLTGANLNVANLIRAIAQGADFRYASFVQAELIRVDFSGSTLEGATLNDADFREAKLRQVNFVDANLSNTDLRDSVLAESYLTRANLHSANLARADLRGTDFENAELRHASLVRANLSGANLRGANLRWADLSGANLRWADLSGAKLSGATLVGANLENTNLNNTIFVHSDLTQAHLVNADWTGADLTGVTLTGAKLHGVQHFRLTIDSMICDWIDLSPNGDQSQIRRFAQPEDLELFFRQVPPTVRIEVDGLINAAVHLALATAYHNLTRHSAVMPRPPSLNIGQHRSTLTFQAFQDEALLALAYAAILPFGDSAIAHEQILAFGAGLQRQEVDWGDGPKSRMQTMLDLLNQTHSQLQAVKLLDLRQSPNTAKWLQAPTQLVITNSHNFTLTLYQNPQFGKRFIRVQSDMAAPTFSSPAFATTRSMDQRAMMDFMMSFTAD